MRALRDHVGETFSDRYRLVARIAGGGMGEVYRGHDLLLDRAVAVKVLQPSLAAEPELVHRFRLEARAAARLAHPNVVGVYDWGEEDERTYYMVMEYVPGSDLRDLLVLHGALEPGQAAEVVASMCDALEAAHSEGLVHRDIKPENVLIARSGVVKVADFGIAAVHDAERTAPGGPIPGTLRYISPEQARGLEATAASDIWAAGAVLAESLTGMPPSQSSGASLLKRRAEEPPSPPSKLDPAVPPELDDIVLRACALDPEDRFDGAGEMAEALHGVKVRLSSDAPPVQALLQDVTSEIRIPGLERTHGSRTTGSRRRRKPRSRLRLVAALLAVVVLAVGGARAVSEVAGPKSVDVPTLVGLPRAEATAAAEEAGLEAEVVDRMRDPEVPRGAIISQNPAGGAVEEGSTIALVVSRGPPLVKIPGLVGVKLSTARARLAAAGLGAGKVTQQHSLEHEVGRVIAFKPNRKRLPLGRNVRLVVSLGPRTIEIPGVNGMKANGAAASLEKAGFAPVVKDAYSDDVEPGRVVAIEPGEGASAAEGSEVVVYVSIGPQYKEFKLPDVRGMSLRQARRRLEARNLRVNVRVSCDGGSTVVETDPLAGTTVRENQRIALFVC